MTGMGLENVNWDEVDENGGGEFTPIPDGFYVVRISKSEVRTTKKGGRMLVLEHTVAEGPHANRLIFENINVLNENTTAQKIGQGVTKATFMACGMPPSNDHNLLLNCTLVAKVVVTAPRLDKNTGITYGASNDIKARMSVEKGYERAVATATAQTAGQSAQEPAPAYAAPAPAPEPMPQPSPTVATTPFPQQAQTAMPTAMPAATPAPAPAPAPTGMPVAAMPAATQPGGEPWFK